ncbi:hypothetical protein ABIA24_006328 [Sinorhizobium fredii]
MKTVTQMKAGVSAMFYSEKFIGVTMAQNG